MIERTSNMDVWVKIPEYKGLDYIKLLKDYVSCHDVYLSRDQEFPATHPEDSAGSNFYNPIQTFKEGDIYRLDILTKGKGKIGIGSDKETGCAQFIVDEEKIMLRPVRGWDGLMVDCRERIGDDFLDYLIKKRIDISND